MKTEGLRVQTTIPAAPTTLYLAWLSTEQHSAMTGGTAKIDPQVGAKYSVWDGQATGKLVVLDLGRRIIMSLRTGDFPRDAADSKVEIHLEALGGSTRLTVLQTELPEGHAAKFRTWWTDKYFTPMRVFFSKYLPDPRKPPPPRRPIPPPDEEEEEVAPPKKGKLAAKAPPPAKGKPAPAKAAPAAKAPPPAKGTKAPAAKAPPPAKSKAIPAKTPGKAPAKPAPPPPKAKTVKPPPAKKPAKPAPKKPAPKKPAPKGKKK